MYDPGCCPTRVTMNAAAKRLAIFVPGLYGGGAERAMLKLARGIVMRGYAVDLVLARVEGPYLAEVPESVRLVDLKARRVLTSLPALVRYLRREQPAALLSVLHANVVALWARRLAGVPTRVVVSERNTLSYEARHYASDLRMRLAPQLNRRFYPWADAIVAVSKGVADDLAQVARIPRECIRVIYNPIVTPELREKAQAPLEHPWFVPGEPPVILATGRLSAQKDFPTLIQAFARVRQTRPARLLILGEGEERPALEAQAKQLGLERDVSLPGFVVNPYPYMAWAGVFVLSSRWEGLPSVLIEALYCGAPAISTDCPSGPREILADGKYGQLVPVGDVNALARAIGAALDGKTPRPPHESWWPFQLEVVVSEYIDTLLG
jgi:glycosyltransferase involved in cell wall biosynthesis